MLRALTSRLSPAPWLAGLVLLSSLSTSPGQVVPKAQPVEEPAPEAEAAAPKVAKPAMPENLDASWKTQREARSLTLTVPAPRGQIVDRNGVPYAQNRVANYLALVLPYMEGAPDAKVLEFAHQVITT